MFFYVLFNSSLAILTIWIVHCYFTVLITTLCRCFRQCNVLLFLQFASIFFSCKKEDWKVAIVEEESASNLILVFHLYQHCFLICQL